MLDRLEVLDTPREPLFDSLTELAARTFNTPIALISLVDRERQWFKAGVGLDVDHTARDNSFCQHAIQSDEVFVVRDAAADERFRDNPLVTGQPDIRFYAGAPLITPDGHRLGTVCVIDRVAGGCPTDRGPERRIAPSGFHQSSFSACRYSPRSGARYRTSADLPRTVWGIADPFEEEARVLLAFRLPPAKVVASRRS